MCSSSFAGLDLLESAIVLLDAAQQIVALNLSAENFFAASRKELLGRPLSTLCPDAKKLRQVVTVAQAQQMRYTEHELTLINYAGATLHMSCVVSPVETDDAVLLLEFRPVDQQVKIAREEQMLMQQQANRELIRNLAHEIKNPLGGIRGASQLLEHELVDRPELKEYTQVIIQEAIRLQSLMDRLLTPHRMRQVAEINIHEVLERVRSVVLAEHPRNLTICRDYDTSIPSIMGDKEQLIQVVLNIVRNAVQAMKGEGMISLKTRIARQVTLARRRHTLALMLQIIDNGPGIPPALQENIFYPLVSGRADGNGLGLTLAQTFVHQHHGTIGFETEPGRTCFNILLPIESTTSKKT